MRERSAGEQLQLGTPRGEVMETRMGVKLADEIGSPFRLVRHRSSNRSGRAVFRMLTY